ncbi:CBS domain-containing protein [Streptomyces sp. NPDC006259]|uniref:CBS domain-containing protein n=1 Tax=Streptomyces sp. NPDC006259 TaxID=3364740 RepID=UPI0036803A17
MTLLETQPHPASANPLSGTVAEILSAADPQVCDDMSVEVALAVMAAARTDRLVVGDQDGQGTGVVTRDQLTAARDDFAYTDRVRLRDILGEHGASTPVVTTATTTDRASRVRRLGVPPLVDEQGGVLGVLAPPR